MRKTTKFSLNTMSLLILLSFLLMPSLSIADFFKYKDSDGNLIITNRFEDVPEKYRNRVKVIWDADLEAKDPLARRSAAAKEQYERQEAVRKSKTEAGEKKNGTKKGKTLVVEMDESSGQLIRRYE